MSMKIVKKILAGALAGMNAFTAASAEPVKVEKPTDSFISTKEDKKPNRESIWKKIAKGTAITAGVTATVVGVATILTVGKIIGVSELFSEMDKEDEEFCYTLDNIFCCYSVSNIREYIENHCENTELRQSLMYLFRVLDGEEKVNKRYIRERLEYVQKFSSYLLELISKFEKGSSYPTENDFGDMARIYVGKGEPFCVSEEFKSNYELNAIIFYVDHCDPIDRRLFYTRYRDGKWNKHSFINCKRLVDRRSIELLLDNDSRGCFIYKRKSREK